MALNKAYLALIGPDGNSNAGRHWRYATEDPLDTVNTEGYFNNVADLLNVGDWIFCNVVTNQGASNEAMADAGIFVVLSNTSGVVDVGDQTDIGIADSD